MNFFTFFTRLIHFLLNTVFPPRDTARIVETTTFEELSRLCAVRNFEAISYVLPYKLKVVQAFILEAKFHGNKKAHAYLGKVLVQYLFETYRQIKQNHPNSNCQSGFNPFSIVLIPVPLGKKRQKERGYNQVAEIAKNAMQFLKEKTNKNELVQNIPIELRPHLLSRTRETAPQTTLDRKDRLLNMQNVFLTDEPLDPDTLYVIVDDVVTTGSSLVSAHEAVVTAGAKHVQLLALAH